MQRLAQLCVVIGGSSASAMHHQSQTQGTDGEEQFRHVHDHSLGQIGLRSNSIPGNQELDGYKFRNFPEKGTWTRVRSRMSLTSALGTLMRRLPSISTWPEIEDAFNAEFDRAFYEPIDIPAAVAAVEANSQDAFARAAADEGR